ncbi:ABC transporter ATP-binding protein [Petroclostridium sp. X23]|uniref:ABC transporter ATP-binding protein n=1 Tax=Petroclostridium sp. X23 TaxID=3045146 RepID=UPI0024AE2797|nr:ABC transporter ATP-binding protein [Petroclostridium sp. X23]WHH58051.1 ABC transporter ATP-binding protein [Petroclostridium sp. X23]
MLEIKNINVFYGKVQALFNVSLEVKENQIVSIIGSNGAGKTTLMSTIVGLNKPAGGEIKFMEETINNQPTHKIIKKGIIYVPEGRRIFYDLTVAENIEMGGYSRKMSPKRYAEEAESVLAIFPRLKERLNQLGGTLSGGEQQMLAIARGLMGNPKLLMLDEPSLGLAPVIVDEVFDVIVNINKIKKIPIILVEQNASMAMNITSMTYVLEVGNVKYQGPSSELAESPEIKKAYLGV